MNSIIWEYSSKFCFLKLNYFSYTIVNDDTLKLTREIDTALNVAKIVTYTPNRTEISNPRKKL